MEAAVNSENKIKKIKLDLKIVNMLQVEEKINRKSLD